MKFKLGDQVVCTKKGEWINVKTNGPGSMGPKFNELVTIDGFNGDGYLFLKGYNFIRDGARVGYSPSRFEPLITDNELHEQLETIQELA